MLSGGECLQMDRAECCTTHRKKEVDFPYLYPTNLQICNLEDRLETFFQLKKWPRSVIETSVIEIAKAGFFYVGEKDCVKCFYCYGGLQALDRDDCPWFEHAKWFPLGEFLLKKRGLNYVMDVVKKNV